VYDNLSTTNGGDINIRNEHRIRFIKGDILDTKHLFEAMKNHDIVIHMAAQLEVTLLRNKNKIIEDELAQSNLMISKLQKDINEIIGLAKNSDEKLDLLTNHLCQDILERKMIAEEKINKKSWWNCF
jgi:nucleoside-diphosphate-sugar epimerase